MQAAYSSIRNYQSFGENLVTHSKSWHNVRAAVVIEGDNDTWFPKTQHNTLIVAVDGTAAHFTRMDGIGDSTPTRPGDVCLIPVGIDVQLAWRNHAPQQRSLCVEFDASLFTTFTPEIATDALLSGHLVPANFSSRPTLRNLVEIIAAEVDLNRAHGRLFVEAALRLLALEAARSAWSSAAPDLAREAKGDHRISRAIEFIESYFTRDISVIDIAAAAGQSPTQLYLAFKTALGTTPHSWVIDRRLAFASQLLRNSDLPIAVIAIESGFTDQAHLTRTCRARLGKSPGQIRRE